MNAPNQNTEVDSLADAIKNKRPLHPGQRFRVLIGDENLKFKEIVLDDPVVLGRQLIEAAGQHPVEEHAAIALLENGDLEDLRLDESFDLRARGAEKVLVVRSDRSFRFKIDDRDLEWPYGCISGAVLIRLAKLPANYNLWREVRGGHDIKVAPGELIRLDEKGVERFISLIDQTTEGLEALPPDDRDYLSKADVPFDVVSEPGQTGVILKDFALPAGKFNEDTTDVLIMLPAGYPDCPPDMFYTAPKLTLRTTGGVPKAAHVEHRFANRVWQRWSRHNPAWRAGIDGLRTVIARAGTAFETAR